MQSTIFLGDSCSRCGESAQTHLQNPFGVTIQIDTWSNRLNSYISDRVSCNNFVDTNGDDVSRDMLFERVSRK